MNASAENNFPTSPAATDGDAALAADLIANAALATSQGDESARRACDSATRRHCEHPHPDVRVSVVAALARLATFTAEDLQIFLSDPSGLVRRRAVEAAAQIVQNGRTGADVVPPLLTALDDDRSVAEVAAFALGEFGPERSEIVALAAPPLENMAGNHADPLCRESAVAALGALHAGRAAVLAALADKATVRRRAVLALAPFDGPDVDAALQRALTDRDWQVRQAAEDQVAIRSE